MKMIIEFDDTRGMSIATEGKITHTTAMGMIEHARAILRADVLQLHFNAQQAKEAAVVESQSPALRVCKHCMRAITKDANNVWVDLGEFRPDFCVQREGRNDHEPMAARARALSKVKGTKHEETIDKTQPADSVGDGE